jgi:hypothetical protein
MIAALAGQADEAETPVREGAMTFDRLVAELRSPAFRRKPPDEQAHYRIEQFKALEAPGAEVPLPDRRRLHEIIDLLWRDRSPFARSSLLAVIAGIPLSYGAWRALKRIFKEAEAAGDTEVFAALAARFDMALARGSSEIGHATLAYLARRGWRLLRRTAATRPACYADLAADVLAHYEEDTHWFGTLIANHIFFHETKEYNRSGFRFRKRPASLLEHRAFADLWRRSPRPLFSLLERARSDQVRRFAAEALKADFRTSLREVEPAWVARLVGAGSRSIDEFVVWILNNVPRFEQASFRALGLHEAVLRLFESDASEARVYAAEYARTHARDLPVEDLIRLANNSHPAVRQLASDLLQARDARKDVGLEAWGTLLEQAHSHELAATAIRKHFRAKELTLEWFRDRLFSASHVAFKFVKGLLPQVQTPGLDFFRGLIEAIDEAERPPAVVRNVAEFAQAEMSRFDVNTLDRDFLRRLILRPSTRPSTCAWIDEGRLDPHGFGLDFLKALAFHPEWETDPWINALRQDGPTWARELDHDEELADRVLGWLRDVRRFSPADLGFDWLLKLAARSEPRYHAAAVETMIKGFIPADFAPAPAEAVESPAVAAAPASVNFGGASFLFTGKMATMKRKEAEDKVRQSNGTVASGVSAKLYYLVIGDEGSALYGHGKKGDKQLKAEEVNAAGANIKIISETAFLKMLAGAPQAVSQDTSLAGCERLWEMATAPGPADAPLAQFAIKYLRRHHPDIALAETDRPVDPGAEVPAEFLTFDRVKPLLLESRKPLRDLGLELARWELARWSPPADELVQLAESPFIDVRRFVAKALLADDAPEHRRYRINLDTLGPAAVYRFCESVDESTRSLGMQLIERSPRLRVPEELFRLTESPDRWVRSFVIRVLWSLYRDRGITEGWKPSLPPKPTIGAAAKKAAAAAAASASASADGRGPGPPARPEQWPASLRELWEFLRRSLFEVPPPRSEKGEALGAGDRLRPLSARKAKLALIEVMRDLALEDPAFARGALPLLEEFLMSRGQSERAACLVAVTRISHTHPELRRAGAEVAT